MLFSPCITVPVPPKHHGHKSSRALRQVCVNWPREETPQSTLVSLCFLKGLTLENILVELREGKGEGVRKGSAFEKWCGLARQFLLTGRR